jgi:hypothetical protein
MKLHRSIAGAALLALAAGAPLAASAQGDDMSGVKQACGADIQKYCPNIEPGGGRLRGCVRGHWRSLSKDCKSALLEMRAHHQQQSGGTH